MTLRPGLRLHGENAPKRDKPPYVLPETTALALIGSVDLATTAAFLASGQAAEANPLMASLLHAYGPRGLILGKVLLLAGPLAVAELARRRSPSFVRVALRVAIVLYLTLYFVGFLRLNPAGG